MTFSVFWKILLLALIEPVMDQILYYSGMKYTTAAFAIAMCNVLPALTFVMAWIFRLEEVNVKKLHSQGKILGTIGVVQQIQTGAGHSGHSQNLMRHVQLIFA